MRRHTSLLLGTALGIALALAACSSEPPTGSTAQPPAPSITAASATSGTAATGAIAATPDTGNGTAVAVRALQTATKAVPQGRAFDLDRDGRNGQPVWSVQVAAAQQRQFVLTITADGTRVLSRRPSPRPDLDDLREARAARITAPRAIRVAAQHQPGQLDELDLDTTDRGTLVWQAELSHPDSPPTVVTLNALTGAVLTTVDD